jgi:hypothetical protein
VSSPTPPTLGYRIPSLGWRITVGALRMIPLIILLVGLPAAALGFLASHSIPLPLSIAAVTIAGAVLVALSTARYIARPTGFYGPLSIASGAFVLGYLLYILSRSSYLFHVPGTDVTVGVSFTQLVELLLLVPALALASGVVTTIEDARSPRERLPFDFPP